MILRFVSLFMRLIVKKYSNLRYNYVKTAMIFDINEVQEMFGGSRFTIKK